MANILEAVAVSKDYRTGSVERRVLHEVSLAVPSGAFLAIMGPSGSGKSTLLHLLGGLDRPSAGQVLVDGSPLAGRRDDEIAELRRHRIGFVFQAFNLVHVLNALDNVALPGIIAGRSADRCAARARHLLDLVGLADAAIRRPVELSGGEQQRVAIARALSMEPAVVLADEPTGNLDSASGAEVLGVLHRAHAELGQTIVMVTHDEAAATTADRIVRIADGRLAPTVEPAAAPRRPRRTRPLVAPR